MAMPSTGVTFDDILTWGKGEVAKRKRLPAGEEEEEEDTLSAEESVPGGQVYLGGKYRAIVEEAAVARPKRLEP
jgi:hypothetical protein